MAAPNAGSVPAVALGVAEACASLCVVARTRSTVTFGATVLPESEFSSRPKHQSAPGNPGLLKAPEARILDLTPFLPNRGSLDPGSYVEWLLSNRLVSRRSLSPST
jgi:hypothetical protein